MKWAIRIAIIVSTCTLLAGAIAFFFDDSGKPPPQFTVDRTEFELPEVREGERELVIPITNTAKLPRRIIGLQEG